MQMPVWSGLQVWFFILKPNIFHASLKTSLKTDATLMPVWCGFHPHYQYVTEYAYVFEDTCVLKVTEFVASQIFANMSACVRECNNL